MRKGLLTLALMGTMLFGGMALRPQIAAAASDCKKDTSAIMTCGATTPQTFINKVKRNGHGDLPAIYDQYGLHTAGYADFAKTAREGTIYASDGRIVVDGRVVAHSTANLSRTRTSSFNQLVNIGSGKYWSGSYQKTAPAPTAKIMVWFDYYGIARIGVLNDNGAPQKMYAVTMHPTCSLFMNKVAGKDNTYDFTSEARVDNGAQITNVEYDFGDGTKKVTNNWSAPLRHTFTKNATVKVTLWVMAANASKYFLWNDPNCVQKISYQTPHSTGTTPTGSNGSTTTQPATATCSALDQPVAIDQAKRTYRFTAHAQRSSNVTLKNADFDFGDGIKMTGALPSGDTVITSHSYAKAGGYTAIASLHFIDKSTGVQVASADCQVDVTVTDVAPAATTATPVATSNTTPTTTDDKADNTKGTSSLINTGSGEAAAGIFMGTVIVAGFSHFYFRRRLG